MFILRCCYSLCKVSFHWDPQIRFFFDFRTTDSYSRLPLWHCPDFDLMKILSHVTSYVSFHCTELLVTRGQIWTYFCLVYRMYFMCPHSWLYLTGLPWVFPLLPLFFLPIFSILPFVKLYRLPYWISKINTLIKVPPDCSPQIYNCRLLLGAYWFTVPPATSHSALSWSHGNSFSALENNT